MPVFPSDLRRGLAGFALAFALGAGLAVSAPVAAQERALVAHTVTFGSNRAALSLEFDRGSELSIVFEDGRVVVDGESIGAYTSGGSLDSAWRSLLSMAAALENGPLRAALIGWTPPAGISGEGGEVARSLDRTLEDALTRVAAAPDAPSARVEAPTPPPAPETPSEFVDLRVGDALDDGVSGRTLGSLLVRLDLLSGISGDLDLENVDGLRVLIGEDLTVEEGTRLAHPLVVVDGDVTIAGAVPNDLVVIGGEVRLRDSGRVSGRIHLADASFENDGGELTGRVRNIETGTDLEERIEAEIHRGMATAEMHRRTPSIWDGPLAFFGNVGQAIGGVFANLLAILLLGAAGAVVLHFGESSVDAISESARRAPGRSLTVGMAGSFLAIPAWILGIVGLAISIVGIPGLLLWIPFFPVAVALAIGLGYLAVARNVGSWVARQRLPGFGWVRVTNPTTLVFGGLLVLGIPFLLANALHVGGGWFSGLRGTLGVVGVVGSSIVALIGFGAVLTTRGGRKPEYWADDLFGMDPEPSPRRRTASTGWDASGFEASTGPRSSGSGSSKSDMDRTAHATGDAATDEGNGSTEPDHGDQDGNDDGDDDGTTKETTDG